MASRVVSEVKVQKKSAGRRGPVGLFPRWQGAGLSLLMATALVGCGGGDPDDRDGDGVPLAQDCNDRDASVGSAYVDSDGDGFGTGDPLGACETGNGVSKGGDCDDSNNAMYPDNTEICDSIDNNCDGVKDEGVTLITVYRDGDNDGYGDPAFPIGSCTAPSGYVSNSDDCNDAAFGVYPGATEQCDGVDNDCDSDVDENVTLNEYYADADLDGFGDSEEVAEGCVAPIGFVDDDNDCDDDDRDINPDAEEICDGIDNDCDATVDEEPEYNFYRDADGDRYGTGSRVVSCMGAPIGYVNANGDCNDADKYVYPGAPELCDSKDNNCDGSVDVNTVTVTSYRDNDSDGYGNASDSKSDCKVASGYVLNSKDCNDTNPAIHPGAYDEMDDSVDSNCNTLQDYIFLAAGSGDIGYSGDGGPATVANLFGPYGVAAGADGVLYIADTTNQRIRRVETIQDANGKTLTANISTIAGGGTRLGDGGDATAAMLNRPYGLVVDASGSVYIADTFNQRIRRVSPDGTITTVAGDGSLGYAGDGGPAELARMRYPAAVAIDRQGNLLIADTDNSCVRKVTAQTGVISTFAGTGVPGFGGDQGAASSAQLNRPNGISVDLDGAVFIADTYNGRIRKVDTNGKITTVAGNGTAGYSGDGGKATSAALNYPMGVVPDIDGNFYVADSENNVVRRVDSDGMIDTVAGNGEEGYGGDGGAMDGAKLANPSGLTVDLWGNIYIADTLNNRVRLVQF